MRGRRGSDALSSGKKNAVNKIHHRSFSARAGHMDVMRDAFFRVFKNIQKKLQALKIDCALFWRSHIFFSRKIKKRKEKLFGFIRSHRRSGAEPFMYLDKRNFEFRLFRNEAEEVVERNICECNPSGHNKPFFPHNRHKSNPDDCFHVKRIYPQQSARSEERRGGKDCRSRWSP